MIGFIIRQRDRMVRVRHLGLDLQSPGISLLSQLFPDLSISLIKRRRRCAGILFINERLSLLHPLQRQHPIPFSGHHILSSLIAMPPREFSGNQKTTRVVANQSPGSGCQHPPIVRMVFDDRVEQPIQFVSPVEIRQAIHGEIQIRHRHRPTILRIFQQLAKPCKRLAKVALLQRLSRRGPIGRNHFLRRS